MSKAILKAEDVQAVAVSSDTAQGIFLFLSDRERFRQYTTLPLLKKQMRAKGIKIVDAEFDKTFSDLQGIGAGALEGKGNKRFTWYFPLTHVAKMGIGAEAAGPQRPATESEIKKANVKMSKNEKPKVKVERRKGQSFIQIVIPKELLKYVKTSAA